MTDRAINLIKSHNIGLTYDDVQIVPAFSKIEHRSEVNTKSRLVGDIFIEHPLIPANMDSVCGLEMCLEALKNGSMGFFHRFNDNIHELLEDINTIIKSDFNPLIGMSLGIKEHDKWIAKQIYEFTEERCRLVFLIDVAHADHYNACKMLEFLKKTYPTPVIVGNVATRDATRTLCEAGANGIKVGVGPGSLCTTRIMTGVGVPQFTAVAQCAEVAREYDVTIISDGGIKFPGEILKAIGAGANTCMSGYLFAGTSATPGAIIRRGTFGNEREYKVYRGSASRESKLDRKENGNIEGASMELIYRGETFRVFKETLDGIKSGLSYVGKYHIKDAIGQVFYILVSPSSIVEAGPNALYRKEI